MKSGLTNLNDHLFAQLERLSEEKLTPDEIEQEMKRTNAIVAVSDQIVGNACLQLRAARLYADFGNVVLPHLPKISGISE